jgi:hypothetical protein
VFCFISSAELEELGSDGKRRPTPSDGGRARGLFLSERENMREREKGELGLACSYSQEHKE